MTEIHTRSLSSLVTAKQNQSRQGRQGASSGFSLPNGGDTGSGQQNLAARENPNRPMVPPTPNVVAMQDARSASGSYSNIRPSTGGITGGGLDILV